MRIYEISIRATERSEDVEKRKLLTKNYDDVRPADRNKLSLIFYVISARHDGI